MVVAVFALSLADALVSNGQWGTSTQLIRTAGSSDTDCVAPGVPANGKSRGLHTQLVAGLVVGLCVPLAVIVAALVWFFRRRARARREQGIWDRPDLISAAWESPDDSAEPIMREAAADRSILRSKEPTLTNKTTMEFTHGSAVYCTREFGQTGPSSGSINNTRSTFYTYPYNSTSGRSAADLTASYGDMHESRMNESYLLPQSVLNSSRVDSGRENDVIIQHRDAGVVRELPPPYTNRTGEVSYVPPPEKIVSVDGKIGI